MSPPFKVSKVPHCLCRKRGRVSQNAHQLPGFETNGLMDEEGNNSSQDDEDGSENQSMASHDELFIDESFESVKRECQSPNSDSCHGTVMNSSTDTSQGRLNVKHKEDPNGHIASNPGNNSFPQNIGSMYVKSEHHSPSTGQDCSYSNGNLIHNGSSTCAVKMRADSNCSSTSANYEPISKSEFEPPAKTGFKNSSDGNQNVLANGHVARNAGEDWISDLVNFSSW